MQRLTKCQRYILNELNNRGRTRAAGLGVNVGPLRLLEDRGMVSSSSTGYWSIKQKGREALRFAW